MKYLLLSAAFLGATSGMAPPRWRDDKNSGKPCTPITNSVLSVSPDPNSPESFASYEPFHDIAGNLTAPKGFEAIVRNSHSAGALNKGKYISRFMLDLYQPGLCAKECNYHKGCDSFNMYFQRNPVIEPAEGCPNPRAETAVICSMYAGRLEPDELVWDGQDHGPADANGERFQIMIRGSNLYHRIADKHVPSSTELTVTAPGSSTGSIYTAMPSTSAPVSSRTFTAPVVDIWPSTSVATVTGSASASTLITLASPVSKRS